MEKVEYEYMFYDTLKIDHVDPKQDLVIENDSIDYSFCDLTDVVSLKKKDPRAGMKYVNVAHDSDNEEEDK